MKSVICSFLILLLSGCTFLNVLDDGQGFCRSINYQKSIERALEKEVNLESPNGFIGQPYSRNNWDDYWNHRIFHMWNIGPESCGGTYIGPSGPELIELMFKRRNILGLPRIILEEKNSDKQIQT